MKTRLNQNDLVVKKYFEQYRMLAAKKKHLERKLNRCQSSACIDYEKAKVSGGAYYGTQEQLESMVEIRAHIQSTSDDMNEIIETTKLVDDISKDSLYSQLLIMSFVDGLSVDQISVTMDKSVWTLYKRRKDAINYLAFLIRDEVKLSEDDLKCENEEENV